MADTNEKDDDVAMTSGASAVNQASIDEAWARATNNMQTDKVSVQDLLDKAGVTSEDFQAVCSQHPEMIQNIGGGSTCHFLTLAANEVKCKKSTSSCHTGVKNIHERAQRLSRMCKNPDMRQCTTDSLFTKEAKQAEQKYRKDRPYQGGYNGGCSTATMLEASGDYIVVNLENKAYGKNIGCSEDREMNALFYGIKPGVTISIDSIEDEAMRKKKGNTKGGIYGHDAVKRRNNEFACDFEQVKINFARYGKEAHVCFPKDAYVPEEYAKMLIEQAQNRMCGNEQTQIAENTQTQTPVQTQTQTPVPPKEKSTTQPSNTPSVSASDLMKQKGELAEDKKGREGATVALKGGKVDGNVDFHEAKKDLDKKDERPAKQAMREDNQALNSTTKTAAKVATNATTNTAAKAATNATTNTAANTVTSSAPVSTQETNEQPAQPKTRGFRFERVSADDKGFQRILELNGQGAKSNGQGTQVAAQTPKTAEQTPQEEVGKSQAPAPEQEPKKVKTMTLAQLQAYLKRRQQQQP